MSETPAPSTPPEAPAALGSIDPMRVMAYMREVNPAVQMLGIEVVTAVPGRSRFAMTVTRPMCNTFGTLHGGLIFTLADTAFGWTCNARNVKGVTAGADIELLAPAHEGERIFADAVETYREGRNALYDVRVWAPTASGERTIAHVRGRMRLVGGKLIEA